MLKELFEDLKFDVQVHNDLTMELLEILLMGSSGIDHSSFDAFVCCFLTHGKLGVLYTSDAKPVRILDIVEYFDDLHCATLRGKPKMFFIQACLTGQFNCMWLDYIVLLLLTVLVVQTEQLPSVWSLCVCMSGL